MLTREGLLGSRKRGRLDDGVSRNDHSLLDTVSPARQDLENTTRRSPHVSMIDVDGRSVNEDQGLTGVRLMISPAQHLPSWLVEPSR